MSVTGIANRSAAVLYPQSNRVAEGPRMQGFGEEITYGEELAMQALAPTFADQALDPVKEVSENTSCEEVQAYNAYMVEKGYMKPENVDEQRGSNKEYEKEERARDTEFKILETSLTSGIIGFGQFEEDGAQFSARYADDSTKEDPIVQMRIVKESGTEIIVNVHVNQVDPENATELEMCAFLTHLDEQGTSGNDTFMGSYQDLMYRAKNSVYGDARAHSAQDFIFQHKDWRNMALNMTQFGSSAAEALAQAREKAQNGVPYSYLAKDGIIDYKGVIFVCDEEHRSINLGNTSDMSKCIRIPLSGGGSLVVNRDNLGDLAKAIGMFSPEDVNLILRAIAEDAKIQQMKQQIDDETSGIDLVDSVQENDADGEGMQEGMETLETALLGETAQDVQESVESEAEKNMRVEVSAQKEKK